MKLTNLLLIAILMVVIIIPTMLFVKNKAEKKAKIEYLNNKEKFKVLSTTMTNIKQHMTEYQNDTTSEKYLYYKHMYDSVASTSGTLVSDISDYEAAYK